MPRVFLPQILWHSKDNKHCDRIYSIDFQPQTNLADTENVKKSKVSVLKLATGGADEFVHIWQIKIHELAPQYTSNKISFNALKADSNEQPFTVKILARLVGHIGEVNAVRWNHSGNILATGGEDRCVFLWEKTDSGHGTTLGESFGGEYEEYWSRCKHYRLSNVVNSICWCPDDRILAVSTEDGHVSLVDTWLEGSKIRYFEGHTSFAQGVSICPKNTLVASMGSDQSLRIWKRKGEKNWTSVLVLRTARDRPEPLKESEYSIKDPDLDDRRYGRSVFMSEELKTFFRRLDWSPDGRFLVTPAGIRYNLPPVEHAHLDTRQSYDGNDQAHDLNNGSLVKLDTPQEPTPAVQSETTTQDGQKQQAPMASNDTLYTLYIFHRKLIHLGLPMMTHISPTGAFVVVRFCPMELSKLERQRINFFNTFANGNPKDVKIKPVKKIKRTSSLQSQPSIGIKEFFGQSKDLQEETMPSSLGLNAEIKQEHDEGHVEIAITERPEEGVIVSNTCHVKTEPLKDNAASAATTEENQHMDMDTDDTSFTCDKTYKVEPELLQKADVCADDADDDASAKESDSARALQQDDNQMIGKRIVKKPKFYHEDVLSTANTSTRAKPKVARKPKAKQLPEEKEYDTDMEDDVLIPRFMFAVGTIDGSLCFYDTRETGGPVAVLKNLHFCTITDISWSQDGLVCASSSSDGYVTFVIFARSEFY